MGEFRRNLETGILEVWENGKKTGEIVTMGDLIMEEQENKHGELSKTEFQYDKDGHLIAYRDGKAVGRIYDMGELIEKGQEDKQKKDAMPCLRTS